MHDDEQSPAKIRVYGSTDVGRIRQQNEDYLQHCTDLNLFVVADGMGGHQGGPALHHGGGDPPDLLPALPEVAVEGRALPPPEAADDLDVFAVQIEGDGAADPRRCDGGF